MLADHCVCRLSPVGLPLKEWVVTAQEKSTSDGPHRPFPLDLGGLPVPNENFMREGNGEGLALL